MNSSTHVQKTSFKISAKSTATPVCAAAAAAGVEKVSRASGRVGRTRTVYSLHSPSQTRL